MAGEIDDDFLCKLFVKCDTTLFLQAKNNRKVRGGGFHFYGIFVRVCGESFVFQNSFLESVKSTPLIISNSYPPS